MRIASSFTLWFSNFDSGNCPVPHLKIGKMQAVRKKNARGIWQGSLIPNYTRFRTTGGAPCGLAGMFKRITKTFSG